MHILQKAELEKLWPKLALKPTVHYLWATSVFVAMPSFPLCACPLMPKLLLLPKNPRQLTS